MRITGKLFFFFALLGLCVPCVRAENLDRIIATVNGDIILYSELSERIQRAQKANPQLKDVDPAKMPSVERELLQQMIREKLTEQEMKRLKIEATDREVDEGIETVKNEHHISDAQLEELLKKEGQTRAQFRQSIRKELERNRLMDRSFRSKVVITKEQIDARAKSGGVVAAAPEPRESLSSTGSERRRVALIFLPVPEGSGAKESEKVEKQARDILGRIKGGGSFSALAREYSKGPAADEGGDIGFVEADELAPSIAAALKGLRKDDVTGVVKGPNGFYILKMLDVETGKAQAPVQTSRVSGDSVDREKIRKQLFQQEVNRRYEEWVKDLESKAFIKISL
ncbi:MAG: SurA N-terminal domain-containing protein [Syntrophobacteraceae bacterium]|nr:SurA N-terminal domain-containing protein [Desulfobacteraceae bacterium]